MRIDTEKDNATAPNTVVVVVAAAAVAALLSRISVVALPLPPPIY
jgi:hypothetical protein